MSADQIDVLLTAVGVALAAVAVWVTYRLTGTGNAIARAAKDLSSQQTTLLQRQDEAARREAIAGLFYDEIHRDADEWLDDALQRLSRSEGESLRDIVRVPGFGLSAATKIRRGHWRDLVLESEVVLPGMLSMDHQLHYAEDNAHTVDALTQFLIEERTCIASFDEKRSRWSDVVGGIRKEFVWGVDFIQVIIDDFGTPAERMSVAQGNREAALASDDVIQKFGSRIVREAEGVSQAYETIGQATSWYVSQRYSELVPRLSLLHAERSSLIASKRSNDEIVSDLREIDELLELLQQASADLQRLDRAAGAWIPLEQRHAHIVQGAFQNALAARSAFARGETTSCETIAAYDHSIAQVVLAQRALASVGLER